MTISELRARVEATRGMSTPEARMIVDRDVLRLAPAMLAIVEAAEACRAAVGPLSADMESALAALRAQMGGAS